MPKSTYIPTNNPATWWDHVLVHPFDHVVAVLAVMFGTVTGVLAPLSRLSISPSVEVLHFGAVVLVGIALVIGGTAALIGLQWWGENVAMSWGLQILGWSFVAGGFLGFALSAAVAKFSIAGILLTALLALGCLIRCLALAKLKQNTAPVIEKSRRLADEGNT